MCQNCRKSNRQCKRGVRLNFIDTQIKLPPVLAPIRDWNVHFLDESRAIADEYQGGLERYAAIEPEAASLPVDNTLLFNIAASAARSAQSQVLPPIHGLTNHFLDDQLEAQRTRDIVSRYTNAQPEAPYSTMPLPQGGAPVFTEHEILGVTEGGDYVRDPKELFYMQTFVEEVGLWMDSMDPDKYFSEQLPQHALANNMLYNAFLACGARHLALVHPQDHSHETALQYYNTATSYLLQNLQNEQRDTATLATTAVILNVYEVMSERYKERMNHIKGARALIRECGWSARSTGVGAACFWLNIGMETLSALAKKHPVDWNPDEWGVDMDYNNTDIGRDDTIWVHRVLCIVAKIGNFRAARSAAKPEELLDPRRQQAWLAEWECHRAALDAWNRHIPRTLHAMGYVDAPHTRAASAFPEVWLVKRAARMARLLYHVGLLLLAGTNPVSVHAQSHAMRHLELHNALMVCGIIAHNKDRGLASIALRCLSIAGECMTDVTQQREVLAVLRSIADKTSWNASFLFKELTKKWAWSSIDVANAMHAMEASPQSHRQSIPLPKQIGHAPPNTVTLQALPTQQQATQSNQARNLQAIQAYAQQSIQRIPSMGSQSHQPEVHPGHHSPPQHHIQQQPPALLHRTSSATTTPPRPQHQRAHVHTTSPPRHQQISRPHSSSHSSAMSASNSGTPQQHPSMDFVGLQLAAGQIHVSPQIPQQYPALSTAPQYVQPTAATIVGRNSNGVGSAAGPYF